MRALVAIRTRMRTGFSFLDRHHGSVSATAAIVGTLATVGIAVLTIFYVKYSKRQWETMLAANGITQSALNMSQRAYVTIGRKDGVVADFVTPKDPKQNAEILIYFQNTGRLPAKFAWGTKAQFGANGARANYTGIIYTHPHREYMSRTREKSNGGTGDHGGGTIIAGDSVLVAKLGEISQKDLGALPASNAAGLVIAGMFEYCDELGNETLRWFILGYRPNAPVSSLSFTLVGIDSLPAPSVPPPTAEREYLPPCETPAEREKNQGTTDKK
jgi:hypothetical protein